MTKRLYIAATSQHVGKTTTTLGIMAALSNRGLNVGYCKPVGQEFVDLGDLKVDKDALLFSTIMEFDLNEHEHSPVILGKGATSAFLENPSSYNFEKKIKQSVETLSTRHDYIVFEGTGHPGVGSVVNLSNADVARIVDAGVIMIVEGGIGNTIDRLNANLALFREQGIPILGVVINKVIPKKIEKVKRLVGGKLDTMGIKLLGIIPYDKSLSFPIIETIRHAVNGQFLLNRERLDNRVEDVKSGALIIKSEFDTLNNVLMVVNLPKLEKAIHKIVGFMNESSLDKMPLAGILVHGEPGFEKNFMNSDVIPLLEKYKIPVISTHLDTYGSAVRISSLEVKINTRTPWKALKAIEMVNNHVDIDYLLTQM